MDVQRRHQRLDLLWFAVCAVLSSAWCVTAAREIGATFDEPFYARAGLEFWRTGSHATLLRFGTMPLPIDVATLPLHLWECTTGATYSDADLKDLLPWARHAALVFWWILLAYCMRLGNMLGGPWAGRLAVALVASQPTLLAHAALATTDIAITASMLAFVYHFRTGRECSWKWRVGIPGVCLGFALITKASALVFAPLCMVVIEAEWLARRGAVSATAIGAWWWASAPLRRDGLQIGVLGFALCFIYCGSDWQPLPSFIRWANALPEGRMQDAMVWLAENLAIFHNAGEAFARQIGHNIRGHGVFLIERTDARSFWYYFPLALTMKLTVPFLALALGLAIFRPRTLTNWACLTVGVLLLHSLTCRVQIGIRFMLPLMALAAIGMSAAVVPTLAAVQRSWMRRGVVMGISGAVVWSLANCITVWPHGLCFVNELWGGTGSGYLRLSDSNYDWGQGLRELAHWQLKKGIEEIDVWYFGTDPQLETLPMRRVALHTLPIETPSDLETHVRGRYLAVGTTVLHGAYVPHSRTIEILRSMTPCDRTQTFLIFDFTTICRPIAHR